MQFHPIVEAWFRGRFAGLTQAQALGWPAIAQGRHTLIAAPTGSGKTLAAFLTCIDRLVRAGLESPDQPGPERTEVLYVSPLKALSNDVHRNLTEPLREMRDLAESRGTPFPEVRVAVRTGDTSAAERQAMAKRPPHILITTPESLYILLTSESGRRALSGVRTLILDEIHAVAGTKRGSHLALSVERLCRLADGPVTRIGLSATQRPLEEVARLLVGSGNIGPDGRADCVLVDVGHTRQIDLALELPGLELGPIATHEHWDQVLDQVAGLAQSHRTTIVFVNTRRLVERVAHQLGQRLGEEAVVAHHGSLSRQTRHDAEQRLKAGLVKVCVATASLELGIDVGSVELVCQLGSPRSIGLLLQRVGRSGHALAAIPKGRLFPLTRDELIECLALLRAVRQGELDLLAIPPWPLDILAQQIVAACACEEWEEDALYDFCRAAYPYRELPRERFDQVVAMLSEGLHRRDVRRSAWLHRDGVGRRLRGRRGARLAALTSGGAIPDNADYDVVAEPEDTFVGTVNEDFAVESMAGDVFLLGNSAWRIRRVERGRVRVEDAHGAAPTIPFWLGEAPARSAELSAAVSALRDGIDRRLDDPGAAAAWLQEESGASPDAARQAVDYIAEGKRILGAVPTRERIIAERFFDESGGMQLIVHAPLGARINRAWGLALRKRFCRTFDFELQAAATDEGINLSLGPQHSFPLGDIFDFLSPPSCEEVLIQAVLPSPLFGTRWRWDAPRSLALLRHTGGRKVPAPIQRMRAADLLAAVFPAQVACQDNAPGGDIEVPDHPLVFETVRDCLTEALDVEGLKAVLAAMERDEVQVLARESAQPSVFAHQILNCMPYAFLDNAPLEERRARAVTLRRALPEDARELGALDRAAIEREAAAVWPAPRDVAELHDALLTLGVLPEGDLPRCGDQAQLWLDELLAAGRVARLSRPDGTLAWLAAERAASIAPAYPNSLVSPASLALSSSTGAGASQEEATLAVVEGRVECSGPTTPPALAAALGLALPAVQAALAQLEVAGVILRGRFTPGCVEEELCNRRVLARIHRATVTRLRQEIEPVPAATLLTFLFEWQHLTPRTRLQDEAGLVAAIEQLQGFEAAASAWEADLLPARVSRYLPSGLDRLCLSGEVVWGRLARRATPPEPAAYQAALTRNAPVTLALREALPWLLDERLAEGPPGPGTPRLVLELLATLGASFAQDISAGLKLLPSQVDEALWRLVAGGHVTADGFAALRGLIAGSDKRRTSSPFHRRERMVAQAGRWSLLRAVRTDADPVEARARQLLARYGVVCRELLAREPMAPPWRELLSCYRRLEARGEVRGGRFVAGLLGEQYALPEAVEALRRVRATASTGELLAISACDPLNLAGILTPGARVPAVPGNRVVFRDGVPVVWRAGGEAWFADSLASEELARARAMLAWHGAPARHNGARGDGDQRRTPGSPVASPAAAR